MSGPSRNSRGLHEKKPLPHGWIVMPSKTYPDRVYYYNTVTRCSTWKNPCEVTTGEAPGNSRSKSSSPKRKRSRNAKSKSPLQEKKKCSLAVQSLDSNCSITIDNEIEDYDEQHDQYFKNIPVNACSLSRSNFFGPSSPDSVLSLKTDVRDSDSPTCNSRLKNYEKEIWLHSISSSQKITVKKSVALNDLNEASTSLKNSQMDSVKEHKKIQCPESFVQCSGLNYCEASESDCNGASSKRKRSKKRRGKESEEKKKSIEEKIIKNVTFKKRDKTPAQTRLLKLRKQNADMLKELAFKNPDLFASKAFDSDGTKKLDFFDVKEEQFQCANFNESHLIGTDISKNVAQEVGNFSKEEFDEEMDWEPSSEENDVRNINVFRQKLDKAKDSSSDIFFGLQSDHSLPLPTKNYTWFIVLDTNIFVSCLGFVKNLRDVKVPDLGYPVIYVPWRVLQELDHLKDTKIYAVDKNLHVNVRKAITFLNENFKMGHPRIFGQSFEDFAKMIGPEVSAPDDEILQTCIKFQKEHPSKKLMLLTNDKNLESKAIVSGVEVHSKEGFQKKYLNSRSNSPAFSGGPSKAATFKSPTINRSAKVVDSLCEIKSILKDFVPLMVETEMKIAFEGDWVKLAFKKPPWSLEDALECMLKHWRSVFFLLFSKGTQSEVQKLYDRLFKKEAETVEEVVDLIKIVQRLILCIKRSQKKKTPYLDPAEVAFTKLSTLLSSLSPDHSSEVDGGATSLPPSVPLRNGSFCPTQTASLSEAHNNDVAIVKNLFKDIWDSLRSFCCSITDTVHSSGASDAVDLQEIRLKTSQVLNEVTELIVIVEKIFEVSPADINESHPLISHFINFLIRVYPAMEVDLQREFPRCLTAFFNDFEGRSLLRNALKDFKEFSLNLMSAAEYFSAHMTA